MNYQQDRTLGTFQPSDIINKIFVESLLKQATISISRNIFSTIKQIDLSKTQVLNNSSAVDPNQRWKNIYIVGKQNSLEIYQTNDTIYIW